MTGGEIPNTLTSKARHQVSPEWRRDEKDGGAGKKRGRHTGELLIRPHNILAWSCSRLHSDPVGVGCTLKTQGTNAETTCMH